MNCLKCLSCSNLDLMYPGRGEVGPGASAWAVALHIFTAVAAQCEAGSCFLWKETFHHQFRPGLLYVCCSYHLVCVCSVKLLNNLIFPPASWIWAAAELDWDHFSGKHRGTEVSVYLPTQQKRQLEWETPYSLPLEVRYYKFWYYYFHM